MTNLCKGLCPITAAAHAHSSAMALDHKRDRPTELNRASTCSFSGRVVPASTSLGLHVKVQQPAATTAHCNSPFPPNIIPRPHHTSSPATQAWAGALGPLPCLALLKVVLRRVLLQRLPVSVAPTRVARPASELALSMARAACWLMVCVRMRLCLLPPAQLNSPR